MNEITYTYKRTKEDFLAHTIWHRFFKSPFSIIMNFVFPIVAIFIAVMSFWYETDIVVYIAVVYLILMPFLNLYIIKSRINKMFENPDLKIDETTFTYTKEGVNTTSEKGELLLEWIFIKRVYVVNNYIYVYVDRVNSFLINRDFIGEDNAQAILRLFEENLPKGSIKYRKQKSA